jgi:hypothetical protein
VARPPKVFRSIPLTVRIPEPEYAKLLTYLYSPSEGRVPHSAFQKFFTERITEFFANRSKS